MRRAPGQRCRTRSGHGLGRFRRWRTRHPEEVTGVASAKPYKLPLPHVGGRSAEFYQFCKDHELRFQRCKDCRTWRHIPRDMCAKCGSFNWEWEQSSGKGKLFSWTTAIQPMMPQFAGEVPYSPAIVELEEGVRMVTWLTD